MFLRVLKQIVRWAGCLGAPRIARTLPTTARRRTPTLVWCVLGMVCVLVLYKSLLLHPPGVHVQCSCGGKVATGERVARYLIDLMAEVDQFTNRTALEEIESSHPSLAIRFLVGVEEEGESCSTTPSLFSLHHNNGVWQMAVVGGTEFLIYGAYWDDREETGPVVRLLVMVDSTDPPTPSCLFHTHPAHPPTSTRASRIDYIHWQEKLKGYWLPYLVTCKASVGVGVVEGVSVGGGVAVGMGEGGGGGIPQAVSLVASECDPPTNAMRVHYNPPKLIKRYSQVGSPREEAPLQRGLSVRQPLETNIYDSLDSNLSYPYPLETKVYDNPQPLKSVANPLHPPPPPPPPPPPMASSLPHPEPPQSNPHPEVIPQTNPKLPISDKEIRDTKIPQRRISENSLYFDLNPSNVIETSEHEVDSENVDKQKSMKIQPDSLDSAHRSLNIFKQDKVKSFVKEIQEEGEKWNPDEGTEKAERTPRENPLREPKRDLALCHKFLYNPARDFSLRLVEWIESGKAWGIDHFTFYLSSAHPNVTKVLDHYQKSGEVTVLPWVSPGHLPSVPHLYRALYDTQRYVLFTTENVPYTDCLLRHLHSHRYVAVWDMDEFILPDARFHSISDMVDAAKARASSLGLRPASYLARCAYYFDDLVESSSAEVPEYMGMLRHVTRSVKFTSPAVFTKSIHDTEVALGLHAHFALVTLNGEIDRNRDLYHLYPSSEGHLAHYRSKCQGEDQTECNEEYRPYLTRDLTMWRYRDTIVAKTTDVLLSLGLIETEPPG